jgi:glycosyltransferase involved in cell wall biosynthesis
VRIGVNCYLLQPHIGGLKQYFVTLFHELLERDEEHEYVFFWYRQNAEELEQLGTDRWRRHAVLLEDQRHVLAHLDRIDLYFCPFSALYPRPVPRPTVMTLVDIQEVFYPEFFTPGDRYLRELHFPGSTRMADRVITISDFSRRALIEHHRLPPTRVKTVYLCADERYARSAAVGRPPATALPERFILYPANVWQHKNHDVLLRALRLLREERGRRLDLVLTGFGQDDKSPITAVAESHGVRDQVHLLGYLEVEELAYLYQRAEMLAFPSLFEGFGMPLVEAMAAGCPVVAARATSVPEVVGDAAELFDPGSPSALAAAIDRVAGDEAWRETLRARGFRRSREFSATRMAEEHRAAFREAAHVYSRRVFLWRRGVTVYWHRAQLEWRWRAHHPGRSMSEWMKAGGHWLDDPAGGQWLDDRGDGGPP